MSRVPSNAARRPAHRVASSPAVAGFRPAGAALAVAAAFTLQPLASLAQPVGGQVVHGGATFTQQGNTFVVTTQNGAGSNYSSINWQSFSVPAGTVTRFDQPSSTSTSINRVLGSDPSSIYGTLSSNGRLVLVNPAGIAVGQGAVVDTAAFTASTLNMSDRDAAAGRLSFGGTSGGLLRVDGAIIARSGDVVLIAPQVQTGASALVQANGATVLAAGHKVEITGRGLEGIQLEVQAGDQAVNLGTLKGDAVGIFADTLKHSGVIQAQSVSTDGGKVVLKAASDSIVDGTITAAGNAGHGGSIDVLGTRVGLMAGAALDASGAAGGGQVRIGGDYQGKNPDVPNAQHTYVDAQATVKADATQQGDGGRIIVWADQSTRMNGQLSARGGALGGNGGFAEVSGKQFLSFTGRADLRAPYGHRGTLLLDPNDIEIGSAPTTTSTASGGEFSGDSTGTGISSLNVGDLNAQLNASDVLVTTSAGSIGPQGGHITLLSGNTINWNSGSTLTLNADNGISLNGNVQATTSAGAANGGLVLISQAGDITQGSGSTIQVGGLIAQAANGSVVLDQSNTVNQLAGSANGSNFTFNNTGPLIIGSLTLAATSASGINVGDGSIGAVSVTSSSGALTVATGAPIAAGSITLKATDTVTGDIVIDDNVNVQANAGALALDAGHDLKIASGAVSSSSNLYGSDSVSLSAGNDLVVGNKSASADTIAGNSYTSINSSTGPVTLQSGHNMVFGEQAGSTYISEVVVENGYSGGPGVNVTATRDIDFGSSTWIYGYYSPIQVTAGGSILGTGNLSTYGSTTGNPLDGSITMTATGGSLSFGSITSNGSYSSGALRGGNITLTAKDGITGSSSISAYGGYAYMPSAGSAPGGAGGDIKLSAGGDINIGAVTSTGGAAAEGAGGNGGTISIASTGGSVAVGDITSSGGAAASSLGNFNGGTGGNVTLTATGGITANGIVGVGGNASAASIGSGAGGAGGAIQLSAGGDINVAAGIVSGGGSSNEGAGGNAGTVVIQSSGGNLALNGVAANGGQASSSSLGSYDGGLAGDITLAATTGNVSADWIYSAGGSGTGGGAGANGGIVQVTAAAGSVTGQSIISSGGQADAGTAGAGGKVTITAGLDISMPATEGYSVQVNGGNSSQGQGGKAGTISLTSTGGAVNASYVAATGGDSGSGPGGAGGSITLQAAGDAGSEYIESTGGYASNGDAGKGGTISIGSSGGNVNLSYVTAYGGTVSGSSLGAFNGGLGGSLTLTASAGDVNVRSIAVSGGGGSGGGAGGNGGTVHVNASGAVTIAATSADGGYSDTGQAGNGGQVTMTGGGDVVLTPVDGEYSVTADGGSSTDGAGGAGGTITLTSTGGGIQAYSTSESTTPQGGISALGGIGYTSGKGGSILLNAAGDVTAATLQAYVPTYGNGFGGSDGGSISVGSSGGKVTVDSIFAYGGDATNPDRVSLAPNPPAGAGGQVTITAAGDVSVSTLDASGGYSYSSVPAGKGGTISIASSGGNIAVDTVSADGGVSAGSMGAAAGGMGGSITLAANTGTITASTLEVRGGAGSDGGNGGNGGSVHLRAGGTIAGGSVSADGGAGGSGDTGGAGGAGGSILIEHAGSGNLAVDGSTAASAAGGSGGDATVGAGGSGGSGGAGGSISLSSSGGAVVLDGTSFAAVGGYGGGNSDDTTSAASGAMGTLTASGTSVEVVGNVELDAAWTNTGVVNLRGTSLVNGVGSFVNQADLNVFDTAQFLPEGGVDNQAAGRVTATGGAVAVNLLQNSGLVHVLAGSTLTLPLFASNAGTLQVDGTLGIGESTAITCLVCTVAAALPGPVLTNQSTGSITGTGTLVVGNGMGTLDNFGTIAPAGAGTLGTLTLTGNLVMESGSQLALDLLSAGGYDILSVSGNATSGGSYQVTYQPGATFVAGTTFNVLQAGTLDATTLPTINVTQLTPTAVGATLALVANSGYPPAPPPPPPPPPPAPAPAPAVQQVQDQVVTFANLFVQQAEQQAEDDKKDNRIGKDDIVLTDNACQR